MNNKILIYSAIAIAFIIGAYFIFKEDKPTTDVKDPDPNTEGGENKGKDKDKPLTETNAPAKKEVPCYKRDANDAIFKLPTAQALQAFVTAMRERYNDEFISYAAAFLKGIDVAINFDNAVKYRQNIKDFMKWSIDNNKPIVRQRLFQAEIALQIYNVEDLLCP